MDIKSILPVPPLEKAKKILCVQPHPDDTDIGVGGTIAKLAEAGAEIYYLTLTDDTTGFMENGLSEQRRKDQRKQEQIEAGNLLGVKDYFWLDYPDAGDWSLYEARNGIIKYIRKIKPDFIITVDPWLPYEAHQDHIKCGHAASEAAILYNFPSITTEKEIDNQFKPYDLKGIAYYHTTKPNTILKIDEYKQKKYQSVACHKSQFPNPGSLDMLKMYFDTLCSEYAKDKDFKFGEAFKVLNPNFMLHCFVPSVDY